MPGPLRPRQHTLGNPDELEPETPPQNENEMAFYNLMHLAGYFEVAFLHVSDGEIPS
jgi:hypothetical protein